MEEPVKVDLVGGQYEGGDKAKSIQVNELELNTLRGLDLAFEACREISISGLTPDGSQNTVRVRVVLPEAYILIKAFALDERQKEKDAYDIHFIMRHYPPDVEALATHVRPLLAKGLAREGYKILKDKFATLDSVGPSWAAKTAAERGENYEQWQRAAFEFAKRSSSPQKQQKDRPMKSVEVRQQLVEALRLDLIGPDAIERLGTPDEVLPQFAVALVSDRVPRAVGCR